MRSEPIDFVQFTYNVVDREVEARLLPLAAERGIAVIVNRPFRQGALTRRLEGQPLPPWAAEIGATSWAQLILKFIISHPAVTVAIPATTRVDHVRENLSAAAGPMPDQAMRKRIAAYVQALDVGVVDLPAARFPAVLAARLLADVRIAQCGPLASAVLVLAAGLIIILFVAWRPRSSARWLALVLAILWIFVGWSFLWNRYAAINWAAAYVAPAFAVEGVLFLVCRVLARTALLSTGAGLPAGSDISSLSSHSPDSRCSRRYRDVAGLRPRFLASRRIRRRSRRWAFCSSPAAGFCHCSCQSPCSGAC